MKAKCVLIVMMTFSLAVFSQKFDVKKDIILKDKVPYAKITGKVGMVKPADLLVSSMNDDSLFTIKAWNYPTDNPMFQNLAGFQVKFIASGKEMIKSCEHNLTSKDFVVDFIMSDRDFNSGKRENEFTKDLIVNNAIDPAVESEFIEKFNDEPAVQLAKEHEAKEIKILKELFPAKKDANQPLVLKGSERTPTTNGTTETFRIFQGDQLATLDKEVVTNSMGTTYTYRFYRILDEPFTVGDKKIDKVVIATAVLNSFPKMFVNVNGKKQEIHVTNPASAEKELAEILIQNKKL